MHLNVCNCRSWRQTYHPNQQTLCYQQALGDRPRIRQGCTKQGLSTRLHVLWGIVFSLRKTFRCLRLFPRSLLGIAFNVAVVALLFSCTLLLILISISIALGELALRTLSLLIVRLCIAISLLVLQLLACFCIIPDVRGRVFVISPAQGLYGILDVGRLNSRCRVQNSSLCLHAPSFSS